MYEFSDEGVVYNDVKGDPVHLSNFTADIIEEIRFVDGISQQTTLVITGKMKDAVLDRIEVPADKFASLAWVLAQWGVKPVISPIPNAERHLRAAIQGNSNPKRKTVYTHTGWTEISGKAAFLSVSGAITAAGHDPRVAVLLPTELSRFELQPVPEKAVEGVQATLGLSLLGPKEMMWPLIAATVRPPIGPVDYAIHISGQTGTFKTEICSLLQSHYGPRMDARHLPGSWSSTANALEAQAYRCKNAIFCVDDFVPSGSSWQVKALQKSADQLIRAQGNQAGRARLTDISSHQTTMYPRGMILSTGEDIPVNHSIRARLLIIDITPGDVDRKMLSIAQAARPLYAAGMARWIQWIAKYGPDAVLENHTANRDMIRDVNQDVGHTRTPATLGDLQNTISLYLAFALEVSAIDHGQYDQLLPEALAAILECCKEQEQHLKHADPTETFIEIIRLILSSNFAHFRSMDGGIPANAANLGWTEKGGIEGIPSFTAHGPKFGWTNTAQDECYLDANSAYALIVKHARGAISQTKQTMLKRLKDHGVLIRTDTARQRNTVRVTCENQSKHVLVLRLSQILDTLETKSDEF